MRELLQHPTAFCSSPLMSPDGFVLLTGLIGLEFAVAVAPRQPG